MNYQCFCSESTLPVRSQYCDWAVIDSTQSPIMIRRQQDVDPDHVTTVTANHPRGGQEDVKQLLQYLIHWKVFVQK